MPQIRVTRALAAGALLVLPGTAAVAMQAAPVADLFADDPAPHTPPATASAELPGVPGDSPETIDVDGGSELTLTTDWSDAFDIDLSSFDLGEDNDTDGPSAGQPVDSSSPVVEALGASGVPEVALTAYLRAQDTIATTDADCSLGWSLLAAIARVESNHGRFGGAELREDGSTTRPIRGLPLDGSDGVALILDTDAGILDGDTVYDRAVGPMQFIPSTWRSVSADGNSDGNEDPNNIYDAALGSAAYLCSGGGDLSDEAQLRDAVYRYNHSTEYVNLVLSLAEAYENGQGDDLPDPGNIGAGSGGTASSEPTVPDLPDPVEAPASVGVPAALTERVDASGGGSGSGGSINASNAGGGAGGSRTGTSPEIPRDVGSSASRPSPDQEPPPSTTTRPPRTTTTTTTAPPTTTTTTAPPTTTTTTPPTTTTPTTTTTAPPTTSPPTTTSPPVENPADVVEPEPPEVEDPESPATDANEIECEELLEAVEGVDDPDALEDVLLEVAKDFDGDDDELEEALQACCRTDDGNILEELATDSTVKARLEDELDIELDCPDDPDL